jgi:hypothetical protein
MFGMHLQCGIKAVKVKAQDSGGIVFRRCIVSLVHEFTADIARDLGPEATKLRDGLRSGAIEKVTMPIDGIAAIGDFATAQDVVHVGRMCGLKAVVSAPKEDEPPVIQFDFEFTWQEDAWAFLGRHCNSIADVVLTKRQLALMANDTAN